MEWLWIVGILAVLYVVHLFLTEHGVTLDREDRELNTIMTRYRVHMAMRPPDVREDEWEKRFWRSQGL